MAKITTITNPLTGQPAQVDQLDHTAQQIDDGLNIARGVSNPNLLDNWYFGNPVDQRQGRVVKPNTTYYSDNTLATSAGTTSAYVTAYRYATGTASGVNYASFKLEDKDTAPTYYAAPENVVRGYTGKGYGIDRWYLEGGTVSFANGYYEPLVKGTAIQKISAEKASSLVGKTLTVSALTADGLLVSASGIVNPLDQDTKIEAWISSSSYIAFRIFANSKSYQIARLVCERNLLAVKTELGSQQTLAHQDENGNWVLNEIPDYGEQLARCQRYYYDSRFGSVNTNGLSSGAYATVLINPSYNLINSYRFPVTMRKHPAVQIYSVSGTQNRISDWANGVDINGVEVWANSGGISAIGFNCVGTNTELPANSYTFHIVANAEL